MRKIKSGIREAAQRRQCEFEGKEQSDPGRPRHDCYCTTSDVRFWQKADMAIALNDVCFLGVKPT
jgi:hypothetical protein